MGTHVAFLRGVNVGGHNRMPMDELRDALEPLGFDGVETYIQSGNVVFEAETADEETLRRGIEDAVDGAFGYDIHVMVRTRDALRAVVDAQPFDEPASDAVTRYVTFLNEEPDRERREALLAAGGDAEAFAVRGREVYSMVDTAALGRGRATDIGGRLGMPATRRNWTVVTAVLALADGRA